MTDSVRIGLQVGSIDPFWVEVRETILQACRPDVEGASTIQFHASDVELVAIEIDERHLDAHEELVKVDEILALGLDAFMGVPRAESLLQNLLSAGLPVISLVEFDLDHPLYVAPRGLHEAGILACDVLVERLAGRGRVAVVGGRMERHLDRGQSRLQAAAEVFERFPHLEILDLPSPWTYDGCCEQLAPLLAALDRPLDGLFGLSDTVALAAAQLGRRLGCLTPECVVVGINGDPLALAAVAAGEMTATVFTPARHFGQEALRLARAAARRQKLPRHYRHRLQLVTKENVSDAALEKLTSIAHVPSRLVDSALRREEQRLRQLETSLAVSQRIGAILDRRELIWELGRMMRAEYGFQRADVYLMTPEGRWIAVESCGNGSTSAEMDPGGPLSQAVARGRPLLIPDIGRSRRFPPDPGFPDTRARLVIPIRHAGRTYGALDLHSKHLLHQSQYDLDVFQLLADQLGAALRNADLYQSALTAHEEAERANHLKSRLIANVSHELRTPLNVILGYSQSALGQMVAQDVDLSSELQADLRQIEESGQQLARLVDDLLDLSQAEIGALELLPEWIDVRSLLTEVFAQVADAAADDVAWRLELPDILPDLHADPVRVRQILLNLLNNARKFTDRGHVTLGAIQQDGMLHIWVADTGVGITQEAQERIFESFSAISPAGGTGERSRAGVGLGLSVARHLVRLHGGRIEIESRPGHGTVCHVNLPTSQPDHAMPAAAPDQTGIGVLPLEPLLDRVVVNASDLVQRTADFLRQHHAGGVTRCQVAQAVGVSPDYLSRLFRAETGMSPWQYLNRYRVARAQSLLMHSRLSITEIASRVGFADSAYFSRVFRRETGRPPQEFRKSAN